MSSKIKELGQVRCDKLIPYANNAKLHPQSQIEHLAASITEFGFIQPVVVDKNFVIVVGHGRWLALKHLGREHVPEVWQVTGLTEIQIAAMRVIDNQVNAETGWVKEFLAFEMEALTDSGLALEAFNLKFSAAELFGPSPKPENGVDLNLIKSIVVKFPNNIYTQVVAAFHGLAQSIPGLSSNTDVFLHLLDLYAPTPSSA